MNLKARLLQARINKILSRGTNLKSPGVLRHLYREFRNLNLK